MKKMLALILALMLCLGLTACGDTSGESTNGNESTSQENNSSNKLDFLYQEWRRTEDGRRLTFNKDGGCIFGGKEYKYECKEDLGIVSVYTSRTSNLTVVEENGTYKLTGAGTYVPVEQFRAEYVDEAISNAAFGAQEILPGNTYTTESGLTFTFEKAELIKEGTEYFFSLYFVCDDGLRIYDACYASPSETDGYPVFAFGVKEQSDNKTFINFISDRGFSQEEIEEDIKDYGIVVLTVCGDTNIGTEYYVTLDTFSN